MSMIEINPDALERSAVKVSNTASDLAELVQKVEQVKSNVESGWQSEYTSAYTMELDVLKQNLSKISNSTNEVARAMKETAVKVRQVEEENRRLFSGGSGGGGAW